ncbi:hypothetical protein V8F20_008478, partial [Naviculisporaceae sp. PSN 640]
LPHGTPPGIYMIQRPSTQGGQRNITKIRSLPSDHATIGVASSAPPHSVQGPAPATKESQVSYTWGSTGHTIPNHDDYSFLTKAWRQYLASGEAVPAGTTEVVSTGGAALAACNYESFAVVVDVKMIDDFNRILDKNVGYWKTGWVHYDGYN